MNEKRGLSWATLIENQNWTPGEATVVDEILGNSKAQLHIYARLLKMMLLISALAIPVACMQTYPGAHELAIEMATELKEHACQIPFRPGDPCDGRDVRFDADFGNAVYFYVYGINDPAEMQMLVNLGTKLRDQKNPKIPIHLTFYSDLTKSEVVKKVQIRGK